MAEFDEKTCREKHRDLEANAYKMVKICLDRMEDKYDYLRETMAIQFKGQSEALVIATKVLDKKFVEVNNLRAEVLQDREQYLKISEYRIQHSVLENNVKELSDKLGKFIEVTNTALVPLTQEYKVRVTLIGWVAIGSLLISAASAIFHWWKMP